MNGLRKDRFDIFPEARSLYSASVLLPAFRLSPSGFNGMKNFHCARVFRRLYLLVTFAPHPTSRKASGGVTFLRGYSVLPEPAIKRARAYIDGQNLFHAAKEAFGYSYPNYDIKELVSNICQNMGWHLDKIQFYTGIPDSADNAFWNHFWTLKLMVMGKQGIKVFSRSLRYRNETVKLPDGSDHTFLVGQEKGVDIRIALDIVRAVRLNECDVAIVFSQDQDLSEVADEVRIVAGEHGRWVKIASAFPFSPTTRNKRGINNTDWIRIDRVTYDACIDPHDYRPKKSATP